MNLRVVRETEVHSMKISFVRTFFLVSEEQCLRDIERDEKFGALRDDHHSASREAKKKK